MTHASRLLVAFTVVALTAGAARAQVRVLLPAWTDPVLMDSMKVDHPLKADPVAVYAAVQKAYADLGIPIGNTDNKKGIIGSDKFERLHTAVGTTLSRIFSCGESQTGPNADSHRLSIAVATWVTPGRDGGSVLSTATTASAQDIAGAARAPRRCSSLGWLEAKVASTVEKYVK
jgi:hypothetical protein